MLMLAIFLGLGFSMCGSVKPTPTTSSALQFAGAVTPYKTATKVDFVTQVKPILESRCQPCHFQGGKMYDKLPFDRQETITTLGTKLITRIKDEKEQQLIREFLAQP
jgi:hypothetical protein